MSQTAGRIPLPALPDELKEELQRQSPPIQGNSGMTNGQAMLKAILSYSEKPVRLQNENIMLSEEMPMCLYKEYDQESGEWYGCRLRAHGPKVKHIRGGKI